MKTKTIINIYKKCFTKKLKPGLSVKAIIKDRLRNGENYNDYKEEKSIEKYPEYTAEEFEKLNNSDQVKLMEISDDRLRRLLFVKRFSLYVGIPISLLISFFFNTDLTQIENPNFISFESFVLLLDYVFFIGGCSALYSLRNIVLLSNYIPKQQIIEFTKLNLFSKQVKYSVNIDQIQRGRQSHAIEKKILRDKKSNNEYILYSQEKYFDLKLYNTLFPKL